MADVKVAINGFGRIGRLAFRQMFKAEGYDIVAINDLTDPAMLANLLKYDSAQGKWAGHTVVAGEDSITVDGEEIKIYKEADASKLPWKELDVDVVLECKNEFMKYIIDRFGEDVETEPMPGGVFEARVRVSLSPTFYAWVFTFSGDIKILSPEKAVNDIVKMAKQLVKAEKKQV